MNDIANVIMNIDQSSVDIITLLFNLSIAILLAIFIKWHYTNYGSVLSNREEFSQVFPFILLTTVLIITIVKSSIALSLGLVGALSIVRFRTPIKEPEELAYLFISIAAGLGLGANQTMATIVSVSFILIAMMLFKSKWRKSDLSSKNIFFSVSLPSQDNDSVSKMTETIKLHVENVDLRRYDKSHGVFEMVYLITMNDVTTLSKLTSKIVGKFPNADFTFLDQNNLPSL